MLVISGDHDGIMNANLGVVKRSSGRPVSMDSLAMVRPNDTRGGQEQAFLRGSGAKLFALLFSVGFADPKLGINWSDYKETP